MSNVLIVGELGIRERAADLTEDRGRGDGVCPGIRILQQRRQGLTRMGVGHGAAAGRARAQPRLALGIRAGSNPGGPPGRVISTVRLDARLLDDHAVRSLAARLQRAAGDQLVYALARDAQFIGGLDREHPSCRHLFGSR